MNLLETAQRLVPGACEDLLASTEHRASRQPAGDVAALIARPDDHVAGIVDFRGEALSGTLVMLGTLGFFATFLPNLGPSHSGASTPKSAADLVRVRDCAMEMSNQLLGRVKNQLRRLGFAVEPGLPRAVSGYALVFTVRERTGRPFVYSRAGGEVFIWFEAVADDAAAAGPRIRVIPEGDFVEL